LRLGEVRLASTNDANRLLLEMLAAMTNVRSWREIQQVTDGVGNVALSRFDLARPDRLHYRTDRSESVMIGSVQYLRDGSGPWTQRALPEPFSVSRYLASYVENARAVTLGRQAVCNDEPCRVLLWETSGGTAALAGWIGLRSHRLYRLFMTAESHYMTSRLTDFDAKVQIVPPR
ncbi:MAG: hypothetical protein ACRDFW_10405, partial [bacterium]